MKRVIMPVFLVFLSILLIVGCNVIENEDTKQVDSLTLEKQLNSSLDEQTLLQQQYSTSEAEESKNSIKHYLMTDSGKYIYSSYQAESALSADDLYVFKDEQEMHLVTSCLKKGNINQEKIGETIQLEIGSNTIKPVYYMSFSPAEYTSNLNTKFNSYDIYLDQYGNRYYILTDNGKLIKYVNKSNDKTVELLIDESQALLISNSFVKNIIGEEMLNDYSINEEISVMFNQYWISYTRYIHGYLTSDVIIVCVDYNGDISSYTGNYYSLYDNIQNYDLNRKKIEQAEESLVDSITCLRFDNLEIVSKELFVNEDGKLFLGLYTVYGKDSNYSNVFYVEII